MIDAQSEVSDLATVAPEEFYGAYNGTEDNCPTCDDVAEPVYDDVADDSHQYVDDVYWGLARGVLQQETCQVHLGIDFFSGGKGGPPCL